MSRVPRGSFDTPLGLIVGMGERQRRVFADPHPLSISASSGCRWCRRSRSARLETTSAEADRMPTEFAVTQPSPAETAGRRVVVSTFVTLDGYMVGPDEDMSWVIEGFDPEMQADIAEEISSKSDVFVLGRVTYEIFAAYWPHAVGYDEGDELNPAAGKEDPRIIRALNEFPKLVFSRTLEGSEWDNTRIVGEGLEDEIRGLKTQPGRAISIQGSASIVQALARADLVDGYRLYVHPVLLGHGKPLFATGVSRQDLKLSHIKPYANGVVRMSYTRRPTQPGT
jgi:dihydrofolate reductase